MDYKIRRNTTVFYWLLILTLMIFTIIFIGGLTRLTDSGLSMVDWRPILGIFPPSSIEGWLKVFNEYKNTPEFLIVNKSMTLMEFKYIFMWEWFHRFFARCIGVVFIFPMIFFLIKKKLSFNLILSLIVLFLFGLFQSVIGWWMVKSGLSDNPQVSPYRLAFHLTNAIIILSILIWLTLNSWSSINMSFFPKNRLEIILITTMFLILITIISGAFMAGTNAGQSFNTYPLMNDKLIPDDYFMEGYGIINFFENTIAINFNHRWIATLTFVIIIILTLYLKYVSKLNKINLGLLLIFVLAILQFTLGILTLLTNVKIVLASFHQLNSTLLLTSVLFTYYLIKKERNS